MAASYWGHKALARELKGLVAGLVAGLASVGLAYGVSAIVTHGQTVETSQPAPLGKSSAGSGQTASTQVVAVGRALYLTDCAYCHGQQAQGQRGPTLHHLGDPDAKIARNIQTGFPPRMPAFKDQYNATQIKALVAYIQSLN